MTVAELMEILATMPQDYDIIMADSNMFVPGGLMVVERANFDEKETHMVSDQDGDFVVIYLSEFPG